MAAFPGNHDLYGGGFYQPEVLAVYYADEGWEVGIRNRKRKSTSLTCFAVSPVDWPGNQDDISPVLDDRSVL